MTTTDLTATFDDAALQRLTDRTYRDAARCWAEYRAWSDDSDDGRAVRMMLHDAAWSAETDWRNLYDACKARGIQSSGGARDSEHAAMTADRRVLQNLENDETENTCDGCGGTVETLNADRMCGSCVALDAEVEITGPQWYGR